MRPTEEMPQFSATLHIRGGDVPFEALGDWPEDQLRIVHGADYQAAVIGDCLATDKALSRAFAEAAAQDTPCPKTDLPGNYSVIFAKRGQLHARASLSGDHCLYYGNDVSGNFQASTSPTLNQPLQPDIAYAAAQLVIPGAEAVFAERSSFIGSTKLLGGQAVHASGVRRPTTHVYDALLPAAACTFDEAAEQLGCALDEAVQARIGERPLSADLSGGMDSSSLAFLALKNLGAHDLPVFFANPPNPNAGDAQFMRELLTLDSRLQPHYFTRTPQIGRYDYQTMIALPLLLDLAHTVNMSPREKQYLREYHQLIEGLQGPNGVHLNGHGGDEVTGTHEAYLADCLRQGDIRRFLQDGLGYARLHNFSPLAIWQSMALLAHQGMRGALLQAAATLESPPVDTNERNLLMGIRQPGGPGLHWLTKAARHAAAQALAEKAAGTVNTPLGHATSLEALHTAGQAVHARRQFVRASGVSLSLQAPFLDHDVIRAAFAISADQKGSPQEFKRLLRQALAGSYVPDPVLARRSKGSYDAVRARSAVQALPAIRELLQQPAIADLGIVEPGPIHEMLGHIDTASNLALWSLERVVTTELWLRRVTAQPNSGATALTKAAPRTRDTITLKDNIPAEPETAAPLTADSLVVAPNVHAAASPEGTLVFFHRARDTYTPLDRTRSQIARALAHAGSPEAAAKLLQAQHPHVSHETIQNDVARCAKELVSLGLFTNACGSDNTTTELPMRAKTIRFRAEDGVVAREQAGRSTIGDAALASVALTLGSVILKRLPPEQRLPLLTSLQKTWCTRDATPEEASRIMRAVQRLPALGRVACLESSYAAALGAALARRRVAWHQGVSFAPLNFHAWIEAQGQPITTGYDGRVTGEYQSFYAKD